jgi:hypothetical protein
VQVPGSGIAPEFLDLEEVLEIHALQLDEFGGIVRVRDGGLLESAVEQPRATAFGELLHADLFEMAATYRFHIVSGPLSCCTHVPRRYSKERICMERAGFNGMKLEPI